MGQAEQREIVGKQVIVPPLEARRETIGLLLALAVLVALMTLRFVLLSGESEQQFMKPYHRLDNILQGGQRTLYQAMIAAVPEIVDLRNREGQWPEVELLEMEEVPPFAPQFLPATLQGVVWSSFDGGSWIDYVAQDPSGGETITLLLRVIDLHAEYHPHPHPGIDYDPNEQVAIQVWMFPEANRAYPGERLPEAGWFWVVRPDDPVLTKPQTVQTPTPVPGGGEG